jgi:hypothetical protein
MRSPVDIRFQAVPDDMIQIREHTIKNTAEKPKMQYVSIDTVARMYVMKMTGYRLNVFSSELVTRFLLHLMNDFI